MAGGQTPKSRLMEAADVIMGVHYRLCALASEGSPASTALTQGSAGESGLGSAPGQQKCLYAMFPHQSVER